VRKAVTVVTVLCVAAGPVLLGCSTKSEDSGGTGTGPSETGLRQALSRVAATDDTRAWVGYDAIAELTEVVGKRPGRGFGLLLTVSCRCHISTIVVTGYCCGCVGEAFR
jgi:hypothetical protein